MSRFCSFPRFQESVTYVLAFFLLLPIPRFEVWLRGGEKMTQLNSTVPPGRVPWINTLGIGVAAKQLLILPVGGGGGGGGVGERGGCA